MAWPGDNYRGPSHQTTNPAALGVRQLSFTAANYQSQSHTLRAELMDRRLAAAAPVRFALLQERAHPFLRVGDLAGRGHDLDGVGIRLRLVEIDLGIERLLADPLALGGTARGALEEIVDRVVELSGGHDPVDQAPVERRARVDDVPGQGQLYGALAAHVPGDRHHGRMAEPAALAARCRET